MRNTIILAACFALSGIAPALAQGAAVRIDAVDPHVRLAPPNARATGAFMTLKNTGDADAVLVSASSPAARIVELHDHINDNGVMRMRQIRQIVVPARGAVELKPGSLHVMLIDMPQPLQEGTQVAITLEFSDGSRKRIDTPVRRHQGMAHGVMGH